MTRKEAIEILEEVRTIDDSMYQYNEKYLQALDMAIKALKQTDVLDKIRAEIEKAVWEDVVVSLDGTDETRIPRLDPDEVLDIIDKYRMEQSDERANLSSETV